MSAAVLLGIAALVLGLAIVLGALVWAARGPGAVQDTREVERRHHRRRQGLRGSRAR